MKILVQKEQKPLNKIVLWEGENMKVIDIAKFNRASMATQYTLLKWWQPKMMDLYVPLDGDPTLIYRSSQLDAVRELKGDANTPLLTAGQLIEFIREFAQMNIYTVDERWCIQLLNLEDAVNDIDVSPIWENHSNTLIDVLFMAVEYICDYRIPELNDMQ